MPIFQIPEPGDILVPNNDYILSNETIVEAYGIRAGQPYEVISVVDLKTVAEAEGYTGADVDGWGVDKIKHISSDDVIDINDGNPDTAEFWALFVQADSARLIKKE